MVSVLRVRVVRLFLLLLLVSLTMNISVSDGGGSEIDETGKGVRPSILAGSWYDADPDRLGARLDSYLEKASLYEGNINHH